MTIEIGYLAACITLLSWTVGTFAFTHASRVANPASVNRVRLLYAFVILSFMVMIWTDQTPIELFLTPNLNQYLWFGISGFVGLTLGDYFAFTAYRILGGRRTSLFSCFAPGAALLAAMAIIGEQINLIGILGMGVSVTGILMVVLSRKEKVKVVDEGKGDFIKGMAFAAMGAICQGVGLVLAKKGLSYSEDNFPTIYATWIRMFSASVFVYLIGIIKTNVWVEFKSISFHINTVKPVLIGTLFGPVIGVTFSLLAATHLEASVAQTVFSLLPASVLLTSVILFKEKVPIYSYLAVLVSISGVLILVWRDHIQIF